ncbi:Mg-dependent DNase [Belliella baltica DSM 15883]|uniref:Mg-dependent DNase n=1 Tax=Belliella baltica (strain DSM 15883 / CIP 108006 / LMG 21964 / BA134) TaxID=866536 RepID=I3Z2P4_BELBD|nr:TatD family hydrolase [Belliella baltica]AFL83512.1 Mg-dependent DNase [Belliella baltica DSM 15883]
MNLFDLHTHQNTSSFSIYNQSTNDQKAIAWYSLGLHPWYLKDSWVQDLEKMKVFSQDKNLMAIGECGFDLLKGSDLNLQLSAFTAQIHWAKELGLPIIMHQVKGLHLLQQILKNDSALPAIIWHAYNQKPTIGASLLNFPIYFSFGKDILKPASNAQEFLKKCPLERIFFETDDSELKIEQVFSQASLLLQLPVETLAKQVIDNWNKISKRKIDE